MDRSFHYLLLAAQGLFQRTAMTELSGLDLTEEQYRVLDYLGQHDGSLQEYIAAGSQLDPAAAAAALGQLEQKGLIQRRGTVGTWRAPYVCLTEAGWEKQQALRRAVERFGLERVIAAGDSVIDVPMLRRADLALLPGPELLPQLPGARVCGPDQRFPDFVLSAVLRDASGPART